MTEFVYGLNKSGLSVLTLLKKQKKTFDCWDDNKKIRLSVKKKFTKVKFEQLNKNNLKKYKTIYLTPGLSLLDKKLNNCPKFKIKRDLNLYYQNINKEKIIAITGTNGKSTTTKLIGDIFKLKKIKKNIIRSFIIGKNIKYFKKQVQGKINFKLSKTLNNALKSISSEIKNYKKEKVTILFSPASASFDQFKNFEERGNKFKTLVKLYANKYF